jgi:hypothetical protein
LEEFVLLTGGDDDDDDGKLLLELNVAVVASVLGIVAHRQLILP